MHVYIYDNFCWQPLASLFKDERWFVNGNISEVEDLARYQIQKGYLAVYDYFVTNQQFLKSAKDSAENLISNLIGQLYTEEQGVSVQVQFVNKWMWTTVRCSKAFQRN